MDYFLGIDPGKSGGIAFISECGTEAWAHKITDSERDFWNIVSEYKKEVKFGMIEKVHSSPQMGVRSAFTFGQSYGFLRGMLIASEIKFDQVSPQKWMNKLNCRTGGNKNITKAKAQQLFPKIKITHAIADALLIAEYCRQTWMYIHGSESYR